MALVVARVVRPASKLATARWWTDTTLAADLGVADASRNETYAALDWLPAGRLADDRALPAGRARLLPGQQAGPSADRIRAAHRPDRPAAEAMRDPLVAYGPPTGRHDCGGREQLAAPTIVKGGAVTASGW